MPTPLTFPSDIDLGEFISKEAHDLKSPFNRALGFIKLVMKGMDGPISDQAKSDLTTAYQNNQYALILVSGLVDMARFSRGEKGANLTAVPVDRVLAQVVADWKRQSPKEKPAIVDYNTPECQVQADEMLLRQALSNWISYVAEYAQEDTAVDIQVEPQGQSCVFTIRSAGKKTLPPPECDLTLYGYVASRIMDLLHADLRRAEEFEDGGALIQFALPVA